MTNGRLVMRAARTAPGELSPLQPIIVTSDGQEIALPGARYSLTMEHDGPRVMLTIPETLTDVTFSGRVTLAMPFELEIVE
jgi:hypothetical protein